MIDRCRPWYFSRARWFIFSSLFSGNCFAFLLKYKTFLLGISSMFYAFLLPLPVGLSAKLLGLGLIYRLHTLFLLCVCCPVL